MRQPTDYYSGTLRTVGKNVTLLLLCAVRGTSLNPRLSSFGITHNDSQVVPLRVGDGEIANEEVLVDSEEGFEELGVAAEHLDVVLQSRPLVPVFAEKRVVLQRGVAER